MSGEWFDWEWDETLFAGAAEYYDRGRLPYAPGLAEGLQQALALDGQGRLLDVGCGPGTVTLLFAGLFAEVVGVDADLGMIQQAQKLSEQHGVRNARWVHLRAEDLPAGLDLFRCVTFAASFHWMDRPLVAATVRDMLEPGGVVVHVDNRHQDSLVPPDNLPEPPWVHIELLRRKWLGEDRRAGQGIRNSSPGDEANVFRAAGFEGPQTVVVPDGRITVRTIDDLVAEIFSTSRTAPHLFGERKGEFEAEVRETLVEFSSEGKFAVQLPDNELKIWRVANRPGDCPRI